MHPLETPRRPLTFLHSGGAGDVVYALPFVRQMGGGTLYLKARNEHQRTGNTVRALARLLAHQPYIREVKEYPDLPFFSYDPSIPVDVDLDRFRTSTFLFQWPFPLVTFDALGVAPLAGWSDPWLRVDRTIRPATRFALVSRTPRYRDPKLDWKNVLERARASYGAVFFVGLPEEHAAFEQETGRIAFLPTPDLLSVARLVAGSEAVYCNQSACLTLAQAMGKTYYLEVAPNERGCVLGGPCERLLNV